MKSNNLTNLPFPFPINFVAHNSMSSFLPLLAPSSGQSVPQSESTPEINNNHHQLPVAQALITSSSSNSNLNPNNLVRTVNPGDRVNIPCSLANMGGSIQFAKDDQPIILDSGCAHCQLDISNDGQASLTINRVSSKDQGHWQCWRLDANGKVKQKIPIIQLIITNSPELPILIVNDKELLGGNNLDATITVKENEIVNFKCLIKGAQTPVDYVHWMLDSSQNVTHMSQLMMEYNGENNYITQSLLKLNATKSMNLKSISCLSNHQLWLTPMTVTAFLNILYEPSFTISREPGFGVPVNEGMTVILKCEIDSNPSSSPIWIKDADNKTAAAAATGNSNVNTNNAISGKEASGEPIVLETQDDGSVIFQPAQRSDSGWYRCKTENKYGNFSSFGYYLNVRSAFASSSSQQPQPQPQGQQQQPPVSSASVIPQAISGTLHPSAPPQRYLHTIQHPSQPVKTIDSVYNGAVAGGAGKLMAPNQAAPMSRFSNPSQQPLFNNNLNIMNNDQPSISSSPFMSSQPPVSSSSLPPLPLPMSSYNPNIANSNSNTNSNLCKPTSPSSRLDGSPEIDHPVSTVQAIIGRQLKMTLRFCCNPGDARVFWIHRVSLIHSSRLLRVSFAAIICDINWASRSIKLLPMLM